VTALSGDLALDAWPLVAWLEADPITAPRIRQLFRTAAAGAARLHINAINLGEVFYIAARRRGHSVALELISELRSRLLVVPAADELIMAAALLKAGGGISYADAFAAATAIALNLTLVTGDPELRRLVRRQPALKLHWLGQH
jgi:predicted nucleic acid-binding protein